MTRSVVALTLLLASALDAVLPPLRPAFAVEANEMLADPALEARARTLSAQFRCLVCQNESIDESNAELAHDLRVLIREQVNAGRSDAEIRAFLIARYGEFVLLKPSFSKGTFLLWLGPFLVLAAGAAMIALARRRRGSDALEAPLSEAERARLENLRAE
ncbi:MAG: cytochrome c-type biogenesis protein CcmH [Hyphomicrobiales bacterium]|nr:cytochrome c-type biogenesis protein CcmH [Hyphomicrobiales bacterium]